MRSGLVRATYFREPGQKNVFRPLQHVVTSIFSKCVILYKDMLHQWRNVAAGKTGVRGVGPVCLIKPDKASQVWP